MKYAGSTLLLLLFSTAVYAQKLPEPFKAWEGKWKCQLNNKTVYEQWNTQSPVLMKGDSWRITAEGDSTYFEQLRLFEENGEIYYEPTVPGEHDNGIRFKLISAEPDEWLFYNADNEYPKYIHYLLKDNTHLNAEVYNEENDKLLFSYEKVK